MLVPLQELELNFGRDVVYEDRVVIRVWRLDQLTLGNLLWLTDTEVEIRNFQKIAIIQLEVEEEASELTGDHYDSQDCNSGEKIILKRL